jgi:hypothetical protein
VSVEDESIWICDAAPSVIWVEITFVPETLRIAPISVPLVTPSPEIVNVSSRVNPPEMLRVASDAIVVAPSVVPNEATFEMATTPVEIVVAPVYVFAADRVNVLEPTFFVNAPEPEMIPDRVWAVDDAYVNVVDEPSAIPAEYEPDPNEPVPDTVIPPPEAEIVVDPEYVFVPESVSVPEPDFVTVPDPVAIAPETVNEPVPLKVVLTFEPDTPPDNVNVEASDMNVDAPVTVTSPEIVFAPATFRSTPFVDTPVPATENASARVIGPDISRAAPELTVVAPALVPSAPLFFAETTPA